jgi:gamma-glutamylcyclotransferase (GGCT)/AIG2-like uncharacterized protein YtfP
MPALLFIYGTLHPERAPAEIASIVRRLISAGPATVRGHRYDFGEYPGVVLDPAGPVIRGEVFTVPDTATLDALDTYEDFRPADPGNSLFLRVETSAVRSDGSAVTCWIYVYNREAGGSV